MPVFYDRYLSWVERWIPRSGLPPAPARHSALEQEPNAKFAIESGCRYFDLGQSGDVANLQTHKNTLRAAPHRIVDLRIEPITVTRLCTAAERGKDGLVGPLHRLRGATPSTS